MSNSQNQLIAIKDQYDVFYDMVDMSYMLYNLSSGASCMAAVVVMKVNPNSVATSQDQDRDEDQDRDIATIVIVKIGGRPSANRKWPKTGKKEMSPTFKGGKYNCGMSSQVLSAMI